MAIDQSDCLILCKCIIIRNHVEFVSSAIENVFSYPDFSRKVEWSQVSG